ncbi:hypothetical protein [Flexithrix dorotheae]|uniref:hypothetical protein n=1 Tax=Flexithrix dorotheae TaxID=70993 RepID=UPI00035CEB42|nr:hypothetical protein [Flexithrix dorotheae]
MKSLIQNLIRKLEKNQDEQKAKKIFIGFDGYIDKIQRAVKAQHPERTAFYKTLTDFSAKIAAASGKSGQVEITTQETKLGGNAPILAHAADCLGLDVTCMGTLGDPEIHPLFKAIGKHSQLISVGKPAETNALEFHDGKLILSEISTFKELDWEHLKKKAGLEKLIRIFNESELLALVDWCNLFHCTAIWQGIFEEVLPHLEKRPKTYFFDLADPSKKTINEIGEALRLIGQYKSFGKVILGMNENETDLIYKALSEYLGVTADPNANLEEQGKYIFEKLNLDQLLIHPIKSALSIDSNGNISLKGRLVAAPKISTGGGDNLNAGFCFGILQGFNTEETLILGMATSGAYVQNGKSPSIKDLINYLRVWEKEVVL